MFQAWTGSFFRSKLQSIFTLVFFSVATTPLEPTTAYFLSEHSTNLPFHFKYKTNENIIEYEANEKQESDDMQICYDVKISSLIENNCVVFKHNLYIPGYSASNSM